MSLQDEISVRAKEIHTDGYPMSIGEVISLYRDGDMDIHPEFQRIFRWTDKQKTSLIESLLLGIPVPPIFVSQRGDGVWDIIDGVQRLSTIFEFMGIYKDHDGITLEPSTLLATEYLPALANYRWEVSREGGPVFTDAMRRDIKRSKLEFRIIEKESDSNAKYDMFQRLNSGSALSAQESRNCLLVMLNSPMYEELINLSLFEAFRECTPLTDTKEDQAYHQELVLRFFSQADYVGGMSELPDEHGEWLTTWMRSRATDGGSPFDVELFRRTFTLLAVVLGGDAFKRWDGARHLGPFSIASFEFLTSGVAAHVEEWEGVPDELRTRAESMWEAAVFRNNSGTGVSARRRVPRLVNEARAYFRR